MCARPFDIARIIANQPQRESAATDVAFIASRAVQNAEIKRDGIARLHRPFENSHPLGIGIRNRHIGILVSIEILFDSQRVGNTGRGQRCEPATQRRLAAPTGSTGHQKLSVCRPSTK